tara:strand:+ start:46 stop:204 length:159 start_codon:yes stop_codon:yes gene_type:complete
MIKISKASQVSAAKHKSARYKQAIKTIRQKNLKASKLTKSLKVPDLNKKKKT